MDTPAFETQGINILIVDDRPENITALRAILNDPSYTILAASSGPEALRQVLKHDLALILLDVFMGEMDGYEVAAMIKSRHKSRHVPIIFLTAMGKDIEHIFKAYSIGAVDYIQKPLEPLIVKAKVAVFAELYRNKLQIKHQAELLRQSELREKEYQILEIKRTGERRLQDLVEGINHGFVWSADPETLTCSYVSPRAELILGYPLEQWRTEKGFWAHHLHPDDRESVLSIFKQAQMGRDLGHDHRFMTVEGSSVWLHTGVRLARKGEGVGYELRGLSVDITHLKRIEDALREAVHVRDEFLSIASHELKTPLTPLKLQIQNLQRLLKRGELKALDPGKLSKSVEMWNRQLDRLTELVDDLLDVSRISVGRLSIKTGEVDLIRLIRDVVEHHKDELLRAGCTVEIAAPDHLLGHWDRMRLEQVVTNLLSNAIRYAPGKPIEFAASEDGETATLSLTDHGVGIPEENQARIFERFERAVSPGSFGGLGLGLYISRQIIEAHGGTIRVESRPGHGAKFVVTLPLRKNVAESAA